MASFDGTAEPYAGPDRGRLRSRLLRRWRLIGAAPVAVLLAYAVAGLRPDVDPQPEAMILAAPPSEPAGPVKPTWAPISRPIHLFALDAPEILGSLTFYEARRRNLDGGRDDILTFGSFDGPLAFMQLSIFRAQQEAIPISSFFLDIARIAADAGLAVGHSTVPAPLNTRFGPFDVADVALGQANTPTNCLGFRFFAGLPRLRIAGLYCGTATHPADRSALRCLINRLDLVSAGEDSALRDWFVAAERGRGDGDCGASRQRGGPPNHWLEVGAAKPILRTGKTALKKIR
jgi:hypothetical protein